MTEDIDELKFLKNLPKEWWTHHGICVSVASILEQYGRLHSAKGVLYFFKKPWKHQISVDSLIKDLDR